MRTRGVQPKPRHRQPEGMRAKGANAGASADVGKIVARTGDNGGEASVLRQQGHPRLTCSAGTASTARWVSAVTWVWDLALEAAHGEVGHDLRAGLALGADHRNRGGTEQPGRIEPPGGIETGDCHAASQQGAKGARTQVAISAPPDVAWQTTLKERQDAGSVTLGPGNGGVHRGGGKAEAAKHPPVKVELPLAPHRRVNDLLGMLTASGGPVMADTADRLASMPGTAYLLPRVPPDT